MNLLDLTSMVNSVFYAIFLYSNIFRFSKFIFGDIVCSRSLSRFYVTVYTMRIGHQVLDVQYSVNSSYVPCTQTCSPLHLYRSTPPS